MYRAAWRAGLKTPHLPRTLSASNVEKATINVKRDVRISNEEAPVAAAPKTYTKAEKLSCSLEARRNGEECEASQ